MADNKTNKPLPKVEAAEDKLPMQQQFNFGQQAEDFRTDSEIQKDLLSKIFTTLLDISGNVTIISEMMPDLLSAQKSLEALRGPDRLAEQEKEQEGLARTLRGDTAKVIKSTADGAIGFFEKVFALITPFLLGFALNFVDLNNPIKLLKAALISVVGFLTGKFVYQLGKSFVNTLLTRALDSFVGPKVINAPNSIINAGGVGTTGTTTTSGRAGRITTQAAKDRYTRRFGEVADASRFEQQVIPTAEKAARTAPRMSGVAAGLSKLKSFGRGPAPVIIATSLLSAPALYSEKKAEGKSTVRAGTETAAGVTGIAGGGIAGGALSGAALGALGANPLTVAIGAIVGGTVGAFVGEKVVSSFTEKVLDFFTGKSEQRNKVLSIFDNKYETLTLEEKLSPEQLQGSVKELMANPEELEKLRQQNRRLRDPSFSAIPKQSANTLEEAQKLKTMLANPYQLPAPAGTNVTMAIGGDTNSQMVVNRKAPEAEAGRGYGGMGSGYRSSFR